MKPAGIRGVIAERGLEGAVIHLAEAAEAGAAEQGHEANTLLYQLQGKLEQLAAEQGHEANTLLYQLQGKLEQLADRVAKLETPQTEKPVVSSENGEH